MLHLLRMYKVINVRFYKHALYNPYLDPFTHVSMECNFFQWQARVGVLSKLPVDILLGNDVSGPTQGAFAVGLSNQQEGALPPADSVTSNSHVASPTLSEATIATEKSTDDSVPASVMESGNVDLPVLFSPQDSCIDVLKWSTDVFMHYETSSNITRL